MDLVTMERCCRGVLISDFPRPSPYAIGPEGLRLHGARIEAMCNDLAWPGSRHSYARRFKKKAMVEADTTDKSSATNFRICY